MYQTNVENIKVVVVGNSHIERSMLTQAIEKDPQFSVVGSYRESSDMNEFLRLHRPDVLAVDAQIYNKGGMKFHQTIKEAFPVPVVMVTGYEDVLKESAIRDFNPEKEKCYINMDKNGDLMDEDVKKEIIEEVHRVKGLQYNQHGIFPNNIHTQNIYNTIEYYGEERFRQEQIKNIIAIAVSAGGPRNLMSVLPLLPGNLPAVYLIVQHMPAGFTTTFAERLNRKSNIAVKEAQDGDVLKAYTAYIAPGGYHMIVERSMLSGLLQIKLLETPPVNSVKPSADVLFDSLKETKLENVIGVVMTGMGKDGCKGLIRLKERYDTHIIAESEESCVVYGMPKAVVEAGIADKIVPAERIASEIIKYVGVDRYGYEPVH